jgi:hypothetical protein
MKTTNTYTPILAEAARTLDRELASQAEARAQLREATRRVKVAQEQLLIASRQTSNRERNT